MEQENNCNQIKFVNDPARKERITPIKLSASNTKIKGLTTSSHSQTHRKKLGMRKKILRRFLYSTSSRLLAQGDLTTRFYKSLTSVEFSRDPPETHSSTMRKLYEGENTSLQRDIRAMDKLSECHSLWWYDCQLEIKWLLKKRLMEDS